MLPGSIYLCQELGHGISADIGTERGLGWVSFGGRWSFRGVERMSFGEAQRPGAGGRGIRGLVRSPRRLRDGGRWKMGDGRWEVGDGMKWIGYGAPE